MPIPNRMKSLEKDARGYPCPVILQRDATGKALFTVNNAAKVELVARRHFCGICGKKMPANDRWLVASARLFTDFRAGFLDPPMHRECAEYALQVCPYIANPSWGKEIAPIMLKNAKMPENFEIVTAPVGSYSQAKPPMFGLGRIDAIDIHNTTGQCVFSVRTWLEVHYWKDGKKVE